MTPPSPVLAWPSHMANTPTLSPTGPIRLRVSESRSRRVERYQFVSECGVTIVGKWSGGNKFILNTHISNRIKNNYKTKKKYLRIKYFNNGSRGKAL